MTQTNNNIKIICGRMCISPSDLEALMLQKYDSFLVPGDVYIYEYQGEGSKKDRLILVLKTAPGELRLYNPHQVQELIDWHILRGLPKTPFYNRVVDQWRKSQRIKQQINAMMDYEKKHPRAHIRRLIRE